MKTVFVLEKACLSQPAAGANDLFLCLISLGARVPTSQIGHVLPAVQTVCIGRPRAFFGLLFGSERFEPWTGECDAQPRGNVEPHFESVKVT